MWSAYVYSFHHLPNHMCIPVYVHISRVTVFQLCIFAVLAITVDMWWHSFLFHVFISWMTRDNWAFFPEFCRTFLEPTTNPRNNIYFISWQYWDLNSASPWETWPVLFCDFFWDKPSQTVCLGLLSTRVLLNSASSGSLTPNSPPVLSSCCWFC